MKLFKTARLKEGRMEESPFNMYNYLIQSQLITENIYDDVKLYFHMDGICASQFI